MKEQRPLNELELASMACADRGMSYGEYVAAGMPGFREYCAANRYGRKKAPAVQPSGRKKKAANGAPCAWCGNPLPSGRTRYCNNDCRLAHLRKLREERPALPPAPTHCACGAELAEHLGPGPKPRLCKSCQESHRQKTAEAYRQRKKEAKKNGRAL